jgi:hypothetical protein
VIKEGWFFLVAGVIAVISGLVDKKSLMVNDVDGDVTAEDKEKAKPTFGARLIYGLVGAASAIYGLFLLQHQR